MLRKARAIALVEVDLLKDNRYTNLFWSKNVKKKTKIQIPNPRRKSKILMAPL